MYSLIELNSEYALFLLFNLNHIYFKKSLDKYFTSQKINFALNQNADGKPIKYTVKEVTELKDYEVSIDVENKGNIVITNRLIETPPEEEPPFDGEEEFEPPSSGNEEFEVDGPSNLGTLSPNGNSFQNVPYEIERPVQKESLPKTGEKTNPWYIVVGVILCLLAIFFIFRNRRHKKQNR